MVGAIKQYKNSEKEEIPDLRKLLSGGLVMFGVVSVPVPVSPRMAPEPPKHEYRSDVALAPLRQFFSKGDCPARQDGSDFLMVADETAFEWRLMPSRPTVEFPGLQAS